jgi:hypothetical protein
MKWYATTAPGLSIALDFFNYNEIPYETIDIWTHQFDQFGRNIIPDNIISSAETGLLLNFKTFIDLVEYEQGRNSLYRYLNNKNCIWVWENADSFNQINLNSEICYLLDDIIPKDSIIFFLDATPSNLHWVYSMKNIKVVVQPVNWLNRQFRIPGAYLDKVNPKKDFMLLTVNKPNRMHRKVLWNKLKQNSELVNHGMITVRRPTDPPVGKLIDGYFQYMMPSMELYTNVWLELVIETCYKNCYYVTEKTLKPIQTKTPFLILSTQYYLKHLRNQGFKTFGHLIDESYDNERRVQDRAQKIINTLNDIVKNGASSFYHASKDILDHNFNMLGQQSGLWEYKMDIMFQTCLDNYFPVVDR